MDTVTLQLRGDDIRIETYAQAIEHFSLLMAELSRAAGAKGLRWEVSTLEAGSATTQVKAAPNGFKPEQVDEVVRSYLQVGKALSESIVIPFSDEVQKHAVAIAEVLEQETDVEAILFETPEDQALVSRAIDEPEAPTPKQPSQALGAVTGQIQTLSSRNALTFTLYDRLHDRAVRCYLREGQESMVEGAWQSNATVIGLVTRDADSGRPVNVRQIESVEILPNVPDAWQEARGALRTKSDTPPPEVRIREMRDAS
jgi:hypothetical protein